MKHPIHVCLVGADPVANLTPALDPALAPREVVLVVPDGFEQQATWSQKVLEPRGITVTRWPVGDPYDIVTTRERIFELVAEREDSRPALNASGGARPLSLAAYEVFRQLDLPVFYVHPSTDDLVFLSHPDHPDDGTPSRQIADRLKLDAYLAAHGARIESTGPAVGVPADLRALCADLVAQAEEITRPISTLNYLAGTAEGSLYSESLGPGLRTADDLQALIRRFERAGCLARAGDRLVFPDEERRFFVQGGWLEAHVYGALVGLRSARPTLQDLARGVQIARSVGASAVRNEIDVAFLADNRLHVIECKTACLERGDAGTAALYKLDSLADLLGGAHGRAMLVSFRPLEGYQKRRATELGIEVVAGRALASLEQRLLDWIPPART